MSDARLLLWMMLAAAGALGLGLIVSAALLRRSRAVISTRAESHGKSMSDLAISVISSVISAFPDRPLSCRPFSPPDALRPMKKHRTRFHGCP